MQGRYAQSAYKPWFQKASCRHITGEIGDDGALRFTLSNISRIYSGLGTALLGNSNQSSITANWQGEFGATLGWVEKTAFSGENVIGLYGTVEMRVGERRVIHGLRGKCGTEPDAAKWREESTKLGVMTSGSIGLRYSGRCGGTTPAIEIVFNALREGSEQISLFGDLININVTK